MHRKRPVSAFGLLSGLAHVRQAAHLDFDDVLFDVGGLVRSIVPFDQVLVFLVVRIGDCFKEHFEARRSADIFRRRAPLSFDEDRQE